jgi:hypothetical protein
MLPDLFLRQYAAVIADKNTSETLRCSIDQIRSVKVPRLLPLRHEGLAGCAGNGLRQQRFYEGGIVVLILRESGKFIL